MPIKTSFGKEIRLSAAIIARNEEDKIKECLDSIAFVDEIILLDSQSTDATAEIARDYGAKVTNRAFDNFSNQKNAAIAQTSGDWILLIDADERISPELASEILKTLQDGTDCSGFWLERYNYFFGARLRYGASKQDFQLRLIQRGAGLFEGEVHERIHLKGKSGVLESPMIHYSTPDIAAYFKRFNLYTTLEAEKIYRKGIRPTAVHILLRPVLEFCYFYFLKLGFLDGMTGLKYQILSSFYTAVKYMKVIEFYKLETQPSREKISV